MGTTTSLSTAYGLFLVEFHGVIQQYIFSGNEPEGLGNLIQEHGKHGVQAIKRFDTVKSQFKKISKSEVENLFGWDTHSIQQLKSKNFI